MSKKIEPNDIKWFGPLWRRIALAAAVGIWCGFEFVGGDQFWSLMTLAVFAYLIWRLFIAFPNAEEIAVYEAEQRAKAAGATAKQEQPTEGSDEPDAP
jgi:hypothetical protein